MHLLSLLVVVAATLGTTLGYKVLVVFPVPSRSHNLLAKGIVDSLLKAGHEVSWATPYPDSKPVKNLNIIDISATRNDSLDMLAHKDDRNFFKSFTTNISTDAIGSPALRDALVNQQFDAVVSEWFLSDTDAGYAAIQQVPWIMLCGSALHPYLESLVDEVRSMTTIPFLMANFPEHMNFFQRVANTAIYAMIFVSNWFTIPETAARYEQYFAPLAAARGVSLPPFRTALQNISVLLVNSHPSVAPAQSLPPNVIDVAGYHIEENPSPLPKDIQDILDSSSKGVVYFSMGSVLKTSALPEHTKKDLVKILSELPFTVLWKSEQEIQGLPSHVHCRSWWPQASILAHPNVKVFITHGGTLSTIEAVYFGVPLLAVPVFGDQPANADQAVRNGYARKVPYSPDMGPELKIALLEMLKDDNYYKKAKYLSKIFNSRPESPSKLISHYVELAIVSKGAYHLRSKTYQYAWYQRWMLDQLAVLLAALWLLRMMLKTLIKTVCGKRQGKLKKN